MFGCWVQRAIRAGRVIASAALVAGCTQTIHNDPINQPLTANARQVEAELTPDVQTNYDDMVVAKTQKLVADKTHYVPANPQAAQLMTREEVKSLHLDDVDNYQKRLYFWQNVPRRAKYNEIWNEVKAAQ